jgi:hypothetical protein
MIPIAVRGVANVVEKAKSEGEVTESLRDHGLMTAREERTLFVRWVRDVLIPGFEALGIPPGAVADEYDEAWANRQERPA